MVVKFLGHLFRYRKHAISLIPANQIRELEGLYESSGTDPQFTLASNKSILPRRWVFFTYNTLDVDGILEPALFYDKGYGYSKHDVICLSGKSTVKGCLIRLPYNLKSLRLDPADKPGQFHISDVRIFEVGFLPLMLILSWRELQADLKSPYRLITRTVSGLGYIIRNGPQQARQRLVARHRGWIDRPVTCEYKTMPLPAAPDELQWQALTESGHPGNVNVDSAGIDVIVPVYKGYDETLNCIYSVLKQSNKTAFNLVVINDCSPDYRLVKKLRELSGKGLFRLYENRSNLGFVRTVNRGMMHSTERDVVLLNSDAEVYNNWLDRLRAAAYREKRTGTVTPFSNNAEICSYPYTVRDNNMQLELAYSDLDLAASEFNRGRQVRIPTGVGFCMYIRRDYLSDTGYFDEREFGKGYGEENDFCLRGESLGWAHVLAADVFVRHVGASSFGTDKQELVNHSIRVINSRYPGYDKRIQDFLYADPIRSARQNIDIARMRRRAGKEVVLFVSHSWGGGIERHLQDMASSLTSNGVQVCYLRPHKDNNHVGVISCHDIDFLPNLPEIVLQNGPGENGNILARLGITHVHIHSLAGFNGRMLFMLPDMLKAAGLRYDVTIHDFMTLCPRIHLMSPEGRYCGEPGSKACGDCIRNNGSPFGQVDIDRWRGGSSDLLGRARKVFVPNRDVEERMIRYFPGVHFSLRPHPEPALEKPVFLDASREPGEPVRVGILGAIGPHKGSWLVQQCARDAQERSLLLEFIVVGYTDIAGLTSEPNITVTGRYDESGIFTLLQKHRIQTLFFPANLPETYSYTLSWAIRARMLPVAFDIGAIAERMRALGYADLLIPLELGNAPARVNNFLLEHMHIGISPVQEYQFAKYPNMLVDYYRFR